MFTIESRKPPVQRIVKPLSQHWVDLVATAKDNQGSWILAGNYAVGISTKIKYGEFRAFIPDDLPDSVSRESYMRNHWDITTRNYKDGRCDVWVSWLG